MHGLCWVTLLRDGDNTTCCGKLSSIMSLMCTVVKCRGPSNRRGETTLALFPQGTVQKLREVLNLDDTEDSFHLEESKSLAERFFAKVHAWARKTVLGVEYESYMQWRHWRESQGIPLPQVIPRMPIRTDRQVKSYHNICMA